MEDWKEFIKLLNENGVEYLLIGGLALAFHGCPRATGDMDILINPTSENAKALLKALRDFGFKDLDISKKDLEEEGYIIQLGYPPWRIDLHIGSEIPFEELWKRHRVFRWDEIEVRVVDLEDLKRLKRLSGRTKDFADLECLERVHEGD